MDYRVVWTEPALEDLELFKRLAKTNPKVEIVRVFEDGDFVFAHTDYDFNVVEVGFEVFRFEDGLVVEHWDNLQTKPSGPNPPATPCSMAQRKSPTSTRRRRIETSSALSWKKFS